MLIKVENENWQQPKQRHFQRRRPAQTLMTLSLMTVTTNKISNVFNL